MNIRLTIFLLFVAIIGHTQNPNIATKVEIGTNPDTAGIQFSNGDGVTAYGMVEGKKLPVKFQKTNLDQDKLTNFFNELN